MLYRTKIDVCFDTHRKEANTFWTVDRVECRKLKDSAGRCDNNWVWKYNRLPQQRLLHSGWH